MHQFISSCPILPDICVQIYSCCYGNICTYMHISFALVTIYFTYVNKFKVSEIWISSQIFCVQTRSTVTLTELLKYVYWWPLAYRPFFMLALTMKRLNHPWFKPWFLGQFLITNAGYLKNEKRYSSRLMVVKGSEMSFQKSKF